MSNNIPPQNNIPEKKNIEQNIWSRSTLDTLIIESLETKFGSVAVLNVTAINNVNYDALSWEISAIMMDIRRKNPGNFPGLTDEIIIKESPSKSELKGNVLGYIKELEKSRKRLESSILSSTNLFTIIPELTQKDLRQKIITLTQAEMWEYLKNKNELYRYLEKQYKKPRWSIKFVYPKIEELFSWEELSVFPAKIQQMITESIERQQGGYRVSKWILNQIIRHFSDDTARLQKIAKFFNIDITLSNLELNNAQLEHVAVSIFGDFWYADLSEKEKQDVLNKLRNDTDTVINIHTDIFEEINLENIKDTLLSQLSQRLTYLAENQEWWTDIGDDIVMWDLIPENINGKEVWHTVWLDKLEKLFREEEITDPWIHKLHNNAIYRWKDEVGNFYTIRILEEDARSETILEPRLKVRILTSGKSGISKNSWKDEFFSYVDFGAFILRTWKQAKIYSQEEFNSLLSVDEEEVRLSNWEKILNTDRQEITTLERLKEELDTYIDQKWKDIAIEPGMVFVAKSGEKWKESIDVAYTIETITPPYITFTNWLHYETCAFDEFLDVARIQWFQRIAKISSDTDFIHALEKYWVNHAELKDGKLITEKHAHDEHGHDKSEHAEYKFFESDKWGHIIMDGISDWWVNYGEWTGKDMNIEAFREKQKKWQGLTDKEKENLYSWKKVPYGIFLKYLKDESMKATTENILWDPNANYHGHDPHMESGFFKRYMKGFSLADIIHGVKGIWHAIEHYFEKWSKLNGSRAALKMAKVMWLPPDFLAQLQADEINNMKEIIEKLVGKLKWLNGPVARNKALHIVHSKWSRPEEIAAAAMYMIESYWHLYAEDIKHAQWTESFINGLIYACWYTTPSAIREQKEKARNKFRTDMGNEPGQPMQEEEMIWGFLKWMDGNATDNPLAWALVKAMWGPSWWERLWRSEGTKNAIEKGKRQTWDIPNAQWRLNKYLSALATHEFNTAVGMMENVAGKAKSPDMQWAPIIWCLTGMTQYAGTKLAQAELWQFVASKGHSFHAYSFLRNKERNDIYKDVFLSALEWIATPEEILKLKDTINEVQYYWHDDPHKDRDAKKQLVRFEYINSIWKKYQWSGLHDRLQGKNTWLVERVHSHHDKRAEAYLETISGGSHIQMSKDNPPSNDNGWLDEFGHNSSPILKFTNDKLLSFEWHINKIRKDWSTTYSLNKDMYERFWPPIIETMKNLKNLWNEDLQKKQYFQYRKDIVEHFRRLLSAFWKWEATEEVLRSVRAQPYYRDLQDMWISIQEFFTETYSINDWVAEKDYFAWKNNGHTIKSNTGIVDVEGTVANILSNRNNTYSR
jgi:hypothetical protein